MNTDRMDAGPRAESREDLRNWVRKADGEAVEAARRPPLILPQAAFHCDPGDKADTLRSALFAFMTDHRFGLERHDGYASNDIQGFINDVEEAAQELERSVPHWWVYVVIAQSLALLAAAIAYSAPACG